MSNSLFWGDIGSRSRHVLRPATGEVVDEFQRGCEFWVDGVDDLVALVVGLTDKFLHADLLAGRLKNLPPHLFLNNWV